MIDTKAIFRKLKVLLIFFLCWVASFSSSADAQVATPYQSVEQALNYSRQLRALTYNHEAIEYDLNRSRARYRPSIDLMLGYGLGQYSDSVTRQPGADPSDTDLDSRGDATLRLTQKLYDGGETRQYISIQEALLGSANFGIQEATQAIVLDAISAHLDVYRQRELVALAEKDLEIHQDIYQALFEIEQAGAGNIADVTQTQARMARAQSILIMSKGDLSRAISNYKRVVGVNPGELAFAEVPEPMPKSLEEALTWMEHKNPELLAFNARLMEADARVGLARSTYKPKINIELSSRYYDQLEGDPSWQNTNDAMFVLRWNLFNGGQDKEATNAALSRKYESRSNRDDKILELREATTSAWVTYFSLQSQKKAHQDAVASSEKTFDAYLKQYSVSRRSLLDVLNAEKEYFQSARQLVTVSVSEIITAYRILSLGGALQISKPSGVRESSIDFSRLAQTIVFPSAAQSTPPEPQASLSIPTQRSDRVSAVTEDHLALAAASETTSPAILDPLCSIEIGPGINKRVLEQANEMLHSRGFDVRQTSGTGTVRVTRLLEGVYPTKDARKRLKELKKTVDSAFVLPEGGQLALYAGSFCRTDRAIRLMELLEQKRIKVTAVTGEIEKKGRMLVVQQVDRQTAETITEQMSRLGLTAKVIAPGS